jgi:hypothetical protein
MITSVQLINSSAPKGKRIREFLLNAACLAHKVKESGKGKSFRESDKGKSYSFYSFYLLSLFLDE